MGDLTKQSDGVQALTIFTINNVYKKTSVKKILDLKG